MRSELIPKFPGLAALEIIYEDHARGCTNCRLSGSRSNVVFGIGSSERPEFAFVGAEPSPQDDASGYPFTGVEGDLLNRILSKLGTCRENVYICHAVCCVPKPGNRVTPIHYEACQPILLAQIRAVLPRVVVAWGRAAGASLTGLRSPETGVPYNLSNGQAKADVHVPVIVSHSIQTLLDPDQGVRRRVQEEAWQHLENARLLAKNSTAT